VATLVRLLILAEEVCMIAFEDIPEVDVDPYSEQNLIDPYPMHEIVRETAALVRLKPYPGVVASARYAQVKDILQNHVSFISGAGVGLTNFNLEPPFRPKSLILEADPPLHTQTRAVLTRILSPRTVTLIRETFKQQAQRMVEACVAKSVSEGSIDGILDLAQPYPLKVFPDAVGLGPDDRENLLIYGDMIFNSMGPRNDLLAKATTRMGPVTDWIMRQCQRENLRPGGFGDQIYQAVDTGEISAQMAPMLVRSFLSAGVDTTVNGLGNALYCLAHHPEEYAKLRSNPGMARAAFEEGLRFEATAQTFFRTAGEDTQLADYEIPKNTKMLCLLGAANRDSRKWPDPHRFNIDRRPVGHVGLGAGIHGCVGQSIARLEGEVVLTAIAERVQRLEVAGPHTRRLNNTLRALGTLPLRFIPI
jgi:4-methoxybenzoate monooxygenase (O-demethylating)